MRFVALTLIGLPLQCSSGFYVAVLVASESSIPGIPGIPGIPIMELLSN